jgi:hypothetical protein
MRHKTKITLLMSAVGVLACAIAALYWDYSKRPSSIPYDAWPRLEGEDFGEDFPLDRSEDDLSSPRLQTADILRADDFAFTMGIGSGKDGLDVFRVDHAGNASYVFSADGDWWKTEFTLPKDSLLQLRKLLIEIDYLSLKRAYHAALVDGTQWCIRVDASGLTKKVYCNNYFPEAAVRLASWVRQQLLLSDGVDVAKCRRIWQRTADNAAAGLWGK